MDLYLVRLDGTYARYSGVVSDPVLTPLEGDPDAMQGMGEPYRDIPNVNEATLKYVNTISNMALDIATNTGITFTNPTIDPGGSTISPGLSGTMSVVEADDVAHISPRQGVQTYTFWKFEFATVANSPRYSYAEFRRGDIISNTAPNTDPTA